MLACLIVAIFCLLVTIVAMLCFGEKRVREFFDAKTTRGLIAITAGVVMYYTPDEVDRIILMILALFEITPVSIDLLNKDNSKIG